MERTFKFVYVILHYNTVDDTYACVESIHQHCGKENNNFIVIVDNCSPNGSGKEIENHFRDDDRVHVILNHENLGFARGNNVGFRYAKEQLKASFIIMMNSDTKILQDNFQNLLTKEYEYSHCGLIGPKIITPNPPYDSNPGYSKIPSLNSQFKQQFIIYTYWLLSYLHIDKAVQNKFGRQKQRRIKAGTKRIDERCENVKLHGCFWIFTQEYINFFDGLNPKTFLYNEEPLLYVRCMQYGIKTVYNPNIIVFHKEDSSTNSISFKGAVQRRRFLYKNLTRSRWILIHQLVKLKFQKFSKK